jgi:hypothetical protein
MKILIIKLLLPLALLLSLNAKSQNLHKAIQESVKQLEDFNPGKKDVSILFLRSSLNGKESKELENYTSVQFGRYLKESETYKWIETSGITDLLEEQKWMTPQDYETYELLNATNYSRSKLVTFSFLLVYFNDLQDSVSLQSIWIPGGVYENHRSVEVVFAKDKYWYQLLNLPAPVIEVVQTDQTIQPSPEIQGLPMLAKYDDIEVTLVSAVRQSSKLVFTFLLENNVEDIKTPNISVRLLNSNGEEFREKKNTLKHRKLIKGVPTRCIVEFAKKSEKTDVLPVLELNVGFNREILQFRNVPISNQEL